MNAVISKQSRWINGENARHPCGQAGAPFLRRSFLLESQPACAVLKLCTPGWHELYVNGQKADDRVLAPVVTQLDRHVSVVQYEVAHLLRAGKNVIAVLLGNGWYNPDTPCDWDFHHASWRDHPKLLCELLVDGDVRIVSGKDWKVCASPILFNQLREGETYDARLKIPGAMTPETDDSHWPSAILCHPPAGQLIHEDLEPCRITQKIPFVEKHWLSAVDAVYDFGVNLTGWCEITVKGPVGAEVILQYSESCRDNFDIDTKGTDHHVHTGRFQEDRYILKGGGQAETWHPRFTYHGFRYVRIKSGMNAEVQILNIEACFIHNDFASCGKIETSDDTLAKLQELTRRSYLCNFTGIPTDCPHREKNGWTGDAQLAMETGLWNFDSRKAYHHFIRMLADAQRPSGQLPGIVPTGGWGYNWGSGPAWDALLFEGPYQLLRFTGDNSAIHEHYDVMKRYLDYCQSMEDDGCAPFGLGDWNPWDERRMAPFELTSTCYYYSDAVRMAFFARCCENAKDADDYEKLATHIRKGFLHRFDNGDGTFANRAVTAQGAALYFSLAPNPELTAQLLVEAVRANSHKADFGILGAKYIPRVLADYGYANDAYRLLVQPECPGWGFWIRRGATTLWESWTGRSSRNHIMFGDVSAWMFEYPGGIRPDIHAPGFERLTIHPHFITGIDHFSAQYQSLRGMIRCFWKHHSDGIHCKLNVPQNVRARVILPGISEEDVSGQASYLIPSNLVNADH